MDGERAYALPMAPTEPSWRIEESHLNAATAAVHRFALQSPLVPAPWIGPNIWLKEEHRLPTGSFKVRGACTRVSALEDRRAGIVAASAGNHGLGLAYAAREFGVPLVVRVPQGTPAVKVDGMRALGAEVQVSGEGAYDAVEAEARDLAEERRCPFLSPFDDPWVAAGNGGAIGLELIDALPNLARVVVPTGGGGLLVGIAAACRFRGVSPVLVGVESEVSSAMGQSLARGETLTTLAPSGPTLAEGLEGGVSASTHRLAEEAGVQMETVSEDAIARAMIDAAPHLGAIEGSAAVSIAWARRHLAENGPLAGATVLIVTGGNVDAHRLEALRGGWRPGTIVSDSSEE